MSQVTDKYNDPIARAKAQALAEYSAKKTSTVPSEIVDLPSDGRFYPKNHPLKSGKIEMRYMTAFDEDILTNSSYIKNGVAIDKLLETLIITPGVDFGDILNCDKDAMLIAARVLSYGKIYDVLVTSPDNKSLQRSVDLSELDIIKSNLTPNENGIITYETDTINLQFKLLTIKEQKLVSASTTPLFEFLIQSVVSVNGETNKEKIKEFLQYNFLANDSRTFRKYIVDNLPTINTICKFEDDNGGVFEAGFPIRPDFFYQ